MTSTKRASHTTLDERTQQRVLEKCVLVTHLPWYTEIEEIEEHFNRFGTVTDTCLLKGKLKINRACIVRMNKEEEAKRILEEKTHQIHSKIPCVVQQYKGMNEHKEMLEKRRYKMEIRCNMKDVKTLTDKEYCERLEEVFTDSYYVDISFEKEGTAAAPVLNGVVKLKFATDKDRKNAATKWKKYDESSTIIYKPLKKT